jgi:hypothetical protein
MLIKNIGVASSSGGVPGGLADGQDLPGQGAAFPALSAQQPEPAQRLPETQRQPGIAAIDRPAQRRVDVVLVRGQPPQPGVLVGAPQLRVGRLSQPQEVRGERLPHPVGFPGFGQAFGAVGPDRLQHPVSRFAAVLNGQERLLDQAEEGGQDGPRGQRGVLAHLFRRGQGGATREDGQPPGQHLLRVGQ